MRILILVVLLFITQDSLAAHIMDTTATVVCGRNEESTPCVLVLDRSEASYTVTVKKEDREILTFTIDRVKEGWLVLGETRKENLIEVIVDTKDSSYVVVNPWLPNIRKDIVPQGHDGLLIKTVEVLKDERLKTNTDDLS